MTPDEAAGHDSLIEALRYVLGVLDATEGRPSRFTAGTISPAGVEALANLAIGSRTAVAALRGITDPAEQRADVRGLLESELEQYTLRVLGDTGSGDDS
jgi:hypothetical protein